MDDIYVYIVDLKSSVPEMVTQNPDGTYTVILNARYSYERQRDVILKKLMCRKSRQMHINRKTGSPPPNREPAERFRRKRLHPDCTTSGELYQVR